MGERRDVPVADAVYASCAMPGLLPPGLVGPLLCMDGGVLDPLAVTALDGLVDRIIVVELREPSRSVPAPPNVPRGSALWLNAQSIVMRHLSRHLLDTWSGPPLVVVRPVLRDVRLFRAEDPQRVILAGYEAARQVLAGEDEAEMEAMDPYPIG